MSEEEKKTFIDPSAIKGQVPSAANGNEGSGKKRDGLYIIIILLLLLAGGYMGYLISEKNKSLNECTNENTALVTEMEELNLMMADEGMAIGESLRQNLQNMISQYDDLEIQNQTMADSIQAQKDKITSLIQELDDAKGDKKHYMSKVYMLQKETETLRSIMKDYIRTIDSLNQVNQGLVVDLDATKENLNDMTSERDDYKTQSENLTEKVNKGSKLSAFSFLTEGIKEKGTGSYKETDRAESCTHIRSCFTIGENTIATPGDKTLYMRVVTPGGSVLYTSNNNTFKAGDQSLLYSDKKSINYQNQQIDVCVFHRLSGTIEKGNYVCQIYCEGVIIGSDTFVLK
ncbi:MAG: hypothetical protein IPM77_01220 [Crocinitomicaceae bacterium]|nr:hypothetical protein [Crocinitomicaceae bacterium]